MTTAEKSSDATERAMKAAVDMEVHAAVSTTTAAKAVALDEHFPGYDELLAALKAQLAYEAAPSGPGRPSWLELVKVRDAAIAKAEPRP